MTVREFLVERYAVLHNLKPRTVILFGHSIDRLADFLGREPELTDFDDLTVSKYLRWRAVTPHKGRICSPASVAKDKAHLVSLWNAAAKRRLVEQFPDLPRNLVRVPHHAPEAYTVEEVSRMVIVARRRSGRVGPVAAAWLWPTLLMSAWYSGERIGSLLQLRWSQVDTQRRTMTFLSEHRKGLGRTITRHITPQLAEWLEKGRRGPSELVWPWLDHRNEGSIYPRLRYICESAGVTPKGFHSIRKAAGSYVHAAGGDATTFLTHRDSKTTREHYLSPNIVEEASALDYLPPLDLDGPATNPRQLPESTEDSPGDRPAA
jgi:integrase